jgi:hypothetical protein
LGGRRFSSLAAEDGKTPQRKKTAQLARDDLPE